MSRSTCAIRLVRPAVSRAARASTAWSQWRCYRQRNSSLPRATLTAHTRHFTTTQQSASPTESPSETPVTVDANDPRHSAREVMEYDVVIVGGGPAGLSAAIRLKQQAAHHGLELSVCVVEKGAEIGSHILSGNVFEPRALNELIPEWREKGAPIVTAVTEDKLKFLTATQSFPLPTPPSLHNHGNYIISLGALCKWLASQAEELGVEIFSGFSVSTVLYDRDDSVVGVATQDVGLDKAGNAKDTFARGIELRARQTLFAEGARGSCSELLMEKFSLRAQCEPQTYGLGFKEVWEIDSAKHVSGRVQHTIGFPAPSDTWFGSYLYHLSPDDPSAQGKHRVLLGAVVGLDYTNAHLNPYQTFQQWKTHPLIADLLANGKCVSYGARVINEGGYQSIPALTFRGGMLVGDSAGFLNVPKIKGSHTAMKSGIEAANAVISHLQSQSQSVESLSKAQLVAYEQSMKSSWVYSELKSVRNYHPSFTKFGLYGFMAYSGLSAYVLKGREPWTFSGHQTDAERTKLAAQSAPIDYPKPDGVLSFDLLTNLQRSGVSHEEDQPCHLKIKPGMEAVPVAVSLRDYNGPEQRFCPAKVYEFVPDESSNDGRGMRLQINQSNCVHCKSCDIKTPKNYIRWTVPEGGGGPNYENM